MYCNIFKITKIMFAKDLKHILEYFQDSTSYWGFLTNDIALVSGLLGCIFRV